MTTDLASGPSTVTSLFSIRDRPTSINPKDLNRYVPEKINGHIEFRNIHFAYPTCPYVVIFKGFSSIIGAGKSTALVGQSGSDGGPRIVAKILIFDVKGEFLYP